MYGSLDIDADAALAAVRDLRAKTGARVTLTHLVGRAIALAIADRPEVNGIVRFGSLYRRETVDVFFQIAFEGGANLNGQKITSADAKDLATIARELESGARAVRDKSAEGVKTASRLSSLPDALTGFALRLGTFATYDLGLDLTKLGLPYDGFGSAMVTNVGSFGITSGFAPILPISRCPLILLVGEVHDKPVARDGQVVVRPILPIGATFDHRIMDGFHAGALAKHFRQLLEDPSSALYH
ncbi:MAG: 2-oxo acid dehydrogenase subunit E2 [Polyangiales bacterium]